MLKYKLEKQFERINILKSKTNKYRLIINITNFIHSITMISLYVIGLSMYTGSDCVCCTFTKTFGSKWKSKSKWTSKYMVISELN